MIKPLDGYTSSTLWTSLWKETTLVLRPWFSQICTADYQPDFSAIVVLADLLANDPSFLNLNTKESIPIYKSYRFYKKLFKYSTQQTQDILTRLHHRHLFQELDLLHKVSKRKLALGFSVVFNYQTLHQMSFEKIALKQQKNHIDNSFDILTQISNLLPSKKALSSLAPSMIDIWNQTMTPVKNVSLTSIHRRQLDQLLSRSFNKDLDQWRSFCQSIQKNAWTHQQVTLDHVLTPKVFSLLSPHPRTSSAQLSLYKVKHYISTFKTCLDREFAHALVQILGADTYMSWFREVRVQDLQSDRAIVTCSSSFFRDYIQQRWCDTVLRAVQYLSSSVKTLQWELARSDQRSTSSLKQKEKPKKSEISAPLVLATQHQSLGSKKGSYDDLHFPLQKDTKFITASSKTSLPIHAQKVLDDKHQRDF